MARFILHVDMDQFIAAVELLRRPELRGRPVIVGGDGDPTKRGVVSTASYEARAFGVGSAMPLRTALKRCPEAVFLPVDAPAYLAASAEVMRTLRSFPAVVQVAGWDEAFMEIESGAPEGAARRIQRAVLHRTGLWCSIGVGDNKLRAKLASGLAKPAGVFRLTADNWAEVMNGRPTDSLWGIGTKTARKLRAAGIQTVGQLAAADEEFLAGAFGSATGPWLVRLGRGEGGGRVTAAPHVPRSQSVEHTFQRNIEDPAEVRTQVRELALRLARDLAGDGRQVARVAVKVRFAPFDTRTRSVTLPEPTLDPAAIEAGAAAALARFELNRPVRLLGIRAEFGATDRSGRPASTAT